MEFHEQLANLLRLLVAARKSIRLYPEKHPSVREDLQKLDETLQNILNTRTEITIRIVQSELFVDDTALSRQTLDFRNLIDEFNTRKINSISLHAGLTDDELYNFAALLNESDEFWLANSETIDIEMEQRDIHHIHLTAGALLGSRGGRGGIPYRSSKKHKDKLRRYQEAVDTMWQVGRDVAENRSFSMSAVRTSVGATARILRSDQNLCARLAMLKSFDDYTFNHSVNVSLISMLIGTRLGLSPEDIEALGAAAMLHDVGKLVIPLEILNKPGRLTESEWRVMHAHPEQGARQLLERADADDIAITVAYEHHSGYIGDGYPTLVPGKRQHLFSRIVAIADVFDALTSPRAYRPQLSPAEALKYVIDGQGKNFDPLLVKVFFQTTGLYPVGTAVLLNTNETGVVHGTNESAPARPVIKLVYDAAGMETVPELIDLTAVPDSEVWIEKTLPPTSMPANAAVA